MGKRKESPEDSIDSPQSHKKHKKHKKKHKKNKSHDFEDNDDAPKPAIKLKLKIGGISFGTKSITKTEIKGAAPSEIRLVSDDEPEVDVEPVKVTVSIKKPKHGGDDEAKWLKALEKGDLDDNGELKKDKDPLLMTARQKSLLQGKKEKAAMQAMYPGYKIIELTEDQIRRKEKRALKRKEQALEKRETEKKQTIERLLKKQDTKGKGPKGAKSSKRSDVPRYRYTNNKDNISVSVPIGYIYPMAKFDPIPPPKPRESCGVEGCTNLKKYACSKTGIPLCSFTCYKKNMELSTRSVS